MAIAGFFVPATEGVLVVAASAGTVLAVAGVAALAKGKGLAVGAAAGSRARARGKRQVSVIKDIKPEPDIRFMLSRASLSRFPPLPN